MKRILLAGLCLLLAAQSWAQNRTLGVGVTTPNPNAALHVESPTGNQGLILPRLTTLQRLDAVFLGALDSADNGLMVYDTDVNTLYIWNGNSWQSTAEVAGGAQLTYPYDDTVTYATGTNDLFALRYRNDEQKRVMRLENLSNVNDASVLSVMNAGPGLAAYIEAGDSSSTASALYVTTNSDAGGDIAPVAIYGETTGTGALAASFRNQNPQTWHPVLWTETVGLGGVASFNSSNLESMSSAITVNVDGHGPGITINRSNFESTSPSLEVFSPGGHAISAEHSGYGGSAGYFLSMNEESSFPAIEAESRGSGASISALKSDLAGYGDALAAEHQGESGAAARITISSLTNADPAVAATTMGQGQAAIFEVANQQNTSSAVSITHTGQGSAVTLQQQNNGLALDIQTGGLKYSVATITTPGQITEVVGLYKITVIGTYTLPTDVPEGTVCKVFNGTTGDITLSDIYTLGVQSPLSIVAGNLEDMIFIDGAWYRAP